MCTSTKCNAKLILVVTQDKSIEKVTRHNYKFGANTTDEMMLDIKNYGEIVHNHRNCRDLRTDGTCRTIRHEAACFKRKCQDTKRNYREEIKKVLKQNPHADGRDIIRIAKGNLNLIRLEQEQICPTEILQSLEINIKKELAVIKHYRIKTTQCC